MSDTSRSVRREGNGRLWTKEDYKLNLHSGCLGNLLLKCLGNFFFLLRYFSLHQHQKIRRSHDLDVAWVLEHLVEGTALGEVEHCSSELDLSRLR